MKKYDSEENDEENEEVNESIEKLREELGFDPEKFLETMKKFMELYNKFFLLQLPLTADLTDAMKKLFEKQYPLIMPYNQSWYINWVFEAMDGVANSLSIDLVNFFEKVEKNENFKKGYDDYDQYVQLFTKPYEAYMYEIDYSQLKLDAEKLSIYEKTIEEEYQEDLIGCIELNQIRNEFLDLVNKLTISYFDTEFDDLTPDQLIHYNILAGMGYDAYFDVCKELNYYLIEEQMQVFPGLGYYEFMVEEYKKLQDTTT